jgi:putative aminopeptidase FrvX
MDKPDASSRLVHSLSDLMLLPGLSGHEGRVRQYLRASLSREGIEARTDRTGNLIASLPAPDSSSPSVMLFAHMDQIGFFVRRIEADGLLRVERVGGIPEKVLPSTRILLCIGEGRDIPAVFASKSNHVLSEAEKLKVESYIDLYADAGFESADEARAAGVTIGTPAVYAPSFARLGAHRFCGASIDDRAGCAVILEVAAKLRSVADRPTLHVVFSVQEEFNVRGAVVAAQSLRPDIAIQLDITIASDMPDLAGLGEVRLGAGPVLSLYNMHGRGTLNGVIPHPALVQHIERSAARADLPLQRCAIVGLLTDNAYVQFVGEGVACVDLAVPARYAHTPNEVADIRDLERLAALLVEAISGIGPEFSLDRDRYPS